MFCESRQIWRFVKLSMLLFIIHRLFQSNPLQFIHLIKDQLIGSVISIWWTNGPLIWTWKLWLLSLRSKSGRDPEFILKWVFIYLKTILNIFLTKMIWYDLIIISSKERFFRWYERYIRWFWLIKVLILFYDLLLFLTLFIFKLLKLFVYFLHILWTGTNNSRRLVV